MSAASKTFPQALLFAALLCFSAGPAAAKSSPDPRLQVGLVSGWKFHLGDIQGAEAEAFDDASWTAVDLPHTWNARDGQDGGGDYFRGTGWYRRRFAARSAWAGREVYLQFDGANRRADVYLNGHLLGTHLGGFARFRFDATPYVRVGADNVLAVRVNNEVNDIAPTVADFTFFRGIYPDVSLLVTDRLHVETMHYASPGVYLKQERVSRSRADLSATIKLANHGRRAADL